jgi:hypothetical protein
MPLSTRIALVFIAACAISSGASAQKIYKCGANYSQIPCPDGVAVQADDPRTPAQKAAAEKISREETKQANQLEKARLKDEAQAEAASRSAKQENKTAKASKKEDATAKKKKGKEPEYFTAKSAAEPKKK